VNRPFAFMLVAVSIDGKISPPRRPGQPNPIGPALIDEQIMRFHNAQRAEVDAVMVGLNCVRLDDSRLTLREGGKNPTRVVVDGLGLTPPRARILGPEAPTIVAVTADAPARRVRALCARGAEIVTAGRGRFVDLRALAAELHDRFGVRRLMVEGGGTLHRSMLAAGLYDELRLIVCPFVVGGARSTTPVGRAAFWPRGVVPRWRLQEARPMGDYLYVVYRPGGGTRKEG
jgi:2,5-diamino-6-(ribosylamino)-4(3H)-pyrimidinone 5'-phosphate reductase